MRLSTKGRYGVRALVDIALHSNGGPVLLKDIARRQEISPQYLEHLVAPLIRAGMLRSIRGAKGGIALAKPPEEIRLSRVIEVLEGSVAPVECVDNAGLCARSEGCVTRDVWSDIKAAIMEVLESLTLRDLVDRQRAKVTSRSETYSI
ncbi:MAG: RrF2 family transcriptional regulator [Dehalococcoidia bacterium]|nr:RrF2 family transcriptional regulator [Dehalococcoidia bacterium]